MEKILLEVPAALKPLFPAIEEVLSRTTKQVASVEGLGPSLTYQQFEVDIRERVAERLMALPSRHSMSMLNGS